MTGEGTARRRARPQLRALADRLGIIASYVDQTGRSTRYTSDATRERLLSVMGFDAPTEDAARGWLAELDHEQREMILEPVRVVEREDPSMHRVRVRVPARGDADVRVTMVEEAGHTWTARARMQRGGVVEMPTKPPLGYHTITAEVQIGSQTWNAEQSLIVVPRRCTAPEQVLRRPAAGVVANLYATRREEDWGVGDFTTFMLLAEWAAERGAAFVGVNPLHALFNRGVDISPYSPVSRLFRNHIYIDVASVPEFAHSPAARERASQLAPVIAELRSRKDVAYDRVVELKEDVLRLLHAQFRQPGGSASEKARGREYEVFVRARDPELTWYATWMALAQSSDTPDWRAWPASFQDPNSGAVRAFQSANEQQIDFYRWLQFEATRQLGDVATRARTAGMPIGVYQDLAIGTNPGGSDTWANAELFLTGACIGAPPDPYSTNGQNWGLPALSPRVLRAQRYRYWIQVLRRAFEHAGALRIDHIMGLFRSFWIPDGETGKEGAYVRQPSRDLLGILALESIRHDALVVGEDLGTVPPDVPPALRKYGILSSKVLYFERNERGFRPASSYPALSLATVNTHDLPTLGGFWTGRDVELRRVHGLVSAPRDVRNALAERERDRTQLLRLARIPVPFDGITHVIRNHLIAGVHNFLCSTRAWLVGLSVDDLMGETEGVNLPGVPPDKYPSWRRRSRMTVEELRWSFEADTAMGCDARRARR